MAAPVKAKIIQRQKEALNNYLRKGVGHYTQFVELLGELRELSNGEMTQENKDRFAAKSALADKHWKATERLLPKQTNEPDAEPDEDAVSNVHNVIERLIGERVQRSGQAALPNGSVVPVALRPQTGGHGDTGSES